MHKALCDEIDHTGPLHRCNLYGQKDAGFLLSEMLKLGSSKHWQDALEVLTGERQIKVRPLVKFFNPLLAWLREQNKGQSTGWTPECPVNLVVDNGAEINKTPLFIVLILYAFTCID